jgi:hypothetical protein
MCQCDVLYVALVPDPYRLECNGVQKSENRVITFLMLQGSILMGDVLAEGG